MSGPLYIARRLFFRRRRGNHPLAGAALGIALSLIPLVIVDHVADAMIGGIIARYRETSSYHFQVRPWGNPGQQEWEEVLGRIQSAPQVENVWIERESFGLARAGDRREGLTLRALPADLYTRDPAFAEIIEFDSGSWNLNGEDPVLLGREAARRLNAAVGDQIRILTAKRLPDGRYVPKVTRFYVRGVFSSGYQDLDRTWAFISTQTGQDILPPESSETFIGGKVTDPQISMDHLRSLVTGVWGFYDWRQLNRSLLGNLETTRNVLLFVMGIIILVAVFNVMTSLVMLSLERRREIGILKCTGASRKDIVFTFMAAGMLASAAGTLGGLSGGLLLARYVNEIIAGMEAVLGLFSRPFGSGPELLSEEYYLQHIPVTFRWGATLLTGLVTFLLSAAASSIPSLRAARLHPLEVLRKH